MGNKTNITACIISGNEEELICDCILSIVQWVDEIVFVDTGITDRTLAIAKKYGGDKLKVYPYKWKDDFSDARNYSISKSTGDWVFIIDADERVLPEDGEILKKKIEKFDYDALVVTVQNLYLDKETGKRLPKSVLGSFRFFKNSSGPKYRSAVHNKPVLGDDWKVLRIPFTINHLGYDLTPEKMAIKYQRTVNMCKKLTEAEPDNPEGWFHLVRALKVKDGKFNKSAVKDMYEYLDKGIECLKEYRDYSNLAPQLYLLAGYIHHYNEDHKAGIEYGKKSLALKPDYLDAMVLVGMSYTYGVDIDEGLKHLNRYMEEQKKYLHNKVDAITMEHSHSRGFVAQVIADIEKRKETANYA